MSPTREGPRVSPSSRPRATARFNTASSSELLTSFSTQQPAPHARVLRRVHREAGPAGSQHEARVRHLPRGHEPHHVHAPVRRRASRTPNVPECGRPHARSTCSATRDRHGRSTACSPQARRTVRFHGVLYDFTPSSIIRATTSFGYPGRAAPCPPPSGTTWSCPVSVVYFARRAHQQRALAAGDVHRAEQR